MTALFHVLIYNTYYKHTGLIMITRDIALSFQLSNGKIDTKWRQLARNLGICTDNISTQHIWDLCQTDICCPICKTADRKVKLTNIGRTATCGDAACALQHKVEKTKKTTIERYGVDSTSKLQHVKDKQQATFVQKYGAHPSKLAVTQDRRAATNMAKYGAKTPAMSADRKAGSIESYRKSRRENYIQTVWPDRKAAIFQSLGITALDDWTGADNKIRWHHSCGHEWLAAIPDGSFPWCPSCGLSQEQFGVEHYVTSIYSGEIRRNDRKTIAPLELDVYMPEAGLAIEVNGWYWHRDGASTPLRQKYESCSTKQIRLLHIMDWEWNNKRTLAQSYIAHALGKNISKLDARKLTVEKIGSDRAAGFFNLSHINGHVKAAHYYGLVDASGAVLAAMSLSKPRWSSEDLEIIRWATRPYTNIRGGFTKVLGQVIKNLAPRSIVSYCDLRWGTGKVYAAAGFKNAGESKPNYWWIKGNVRLSRYETQKHKLAYILGADFRQDLSEADNMLRCGWSKVSDCGNGKWVWTA